jgi:Ca2+-binding EF-hand superfamily protein
MRMKNLVMCFMFVGVLTAVTVMAEEGAKPERKDRSRHAEERFAAADTDSDGNISLPEFKALHAKRMEMIKKRMGDRFDAERAAKMPSSEEIYAKIDADGNKSVTKEEMSSAHKKRHKHHRGGHGRGGEGEDGTGCNKGGAGKGACDKKESEKGDNDLL